MSRSMSNKDSMKNERENLLDISADDFETPVNFKKFKNSTKVQMSKNECKVKKSSKKKQITLHQMVKQNLKYSDVDPEQLQMALALSKSISDCQTDEVNDIITWDCDDNKNEKRQTLLEFGFKYNKNKMRSENKIIKKGKDTLRTNKKSKFRFITPILYLRTDEDRESLIQSKISLILTQNVEKNSCGQQELGSSHIMRQHSVYQNSLLQKIGVNVDVY
ncbi:hypothetical protein WA026_013761 [Henosepilachna vigintioctopunctata]|uniref:Uncharacterized protein n=1 Tax=Henosepilachna vigintioctopunctata TaxID=420089 RepID=A0AAW1V1E6_9CUCU